MEGAWEGEAVSVLRSRGAKQVSFSSSSISFSAKTLDGARTCWEDMLRGRAQRTCSEDMLRGRAQRTCSEDILRGHAPAEDVLRGKKCPCPHT